MDVISSIPLSEFSEIFLGTSISSNYARIFKQFKLFRILRLAKATKFLKSENLKAIFSIFKIFFGFVVTVSSDVIYVCRSTG